MRITDIKTYLIGMNKPELAILEVFTDEGITGLGECTFGAVGGTSPGVIGVIDWLKPFVINKDPFNVECVWYEIFYGNTWARYPSGGIHIFSCMSAIEIAMWDIIGKKLGLPIYNLLGGPLRDKIKLYHSNWYWECKKPEDVGQASIKAVEDGFKALKIDPFDIVQFIKDYEPKPYEKIEKEITPSGTNKAVEILHHIREAVGDEIEIAIEGHGRFSPTAAIHFGKRIERFDPIFFEEPIPPGDVDSMLRVKKSINIPIATGERIYTRYGYKEIFEKGAVDIIQPDPCFAGGILEIKKIASMAEVYSVLVAPHLCCGPIATAVAMQVDAIIPNFIIQEFRPDPISSFYKELVEEPYEKKYSKLKSGYMNLPKEPGLGIKLNLEGIKKYLYKK